MSISIASMEMANCKRLKIVNIKEDELGYVNLDVIVFVRKSILRIIRLKKLKQEHYLEEIIYFIRWIRPRKM